MARTKWARRADIVANWFGLAAKGTTISGKARIPFRGAIIETRTVRRSSAIAAAEKTRHAGKLNHLPWAHFLFAKTSRSSVVLVLPMKDAEKVARFLADEWSLSGTITTSQPSTGSGDSFGGTCSEPDCLFKGS